MKTCTIARMRPALFAVAATVLGLPPSASAEQIIPKEIEYSNDTISVAGRTVACEVTVAVLSPPDPRALNFQFLDFKDRLAWKITGGLFNPATNSMTALRAQSGEFSSGSFMAPAAFQKSLTPEGQLLGVLTQGNLAARFIAAFLGGPYQVEVTWQGSDNVLSYYIDKSPPPSVRETLASCHKSL